MDKKSLVIFLSAISLFVDNSLATEGQSSITEKEKKESILLTPYQQALYTLGIDPYNFHTADRRAIRVGYTKCIIDAGHDEDSEALVKCREAKQIIDANTIESKTERQNVPFNEYQRSLDILGIDPLHVGAIDPKDITKNYAQCMRMADKNHDEMALEECKGAKNIIDRDTKESNYKKE